MRIKGISWVGVKAQKSDELATFFESVLGLRTVTRRPDFVAFRMPDGDLIEVFGPRGPDPPELFGDSPVICGFLVDDIEAAVLELKNAGVELVGPLAGSDRTGERWQVFRGPDGLLYELCSEPKRP
jgi:catechol 2,3-dioxygenase-like lactoylglutathione lyase family enzyme